MPTSYEKLYENLLPKFRSYEIPLMSTEEVKDYLHDFLIPAMILITLSLFVGRKWLEEK